MYIVLISIPAVGSKNSWSGIIMKAVGPFETVQDANNIAQTVARAGHATFVFKLIHPTDTLTRIGTP